LFPRDRETEGHWKVPFARVVNLLTQNFRTKYHFPLFNKIYMIECEFVDNSWDWASISDSGEASKIRLSILNKQLLKLLMFNCRIIVHNYTRVVLLWLINYFQKDWCQFEQFVVWDWDSISETGVASTIRLFKIMILKGFQYQIWFFEF